MVRRAVVITCPACQGEGVKPDPLSDGFLDEACEVCESEGWIEVEITAEAIFEEDTDGPEE